MALPKDIIELMKKSGCHTVTHLISTISALLLLLLLVTGLALDEDLPAPPERAPLVAPAATACTTNMASRS